MSDGGGFGPVFVIAGDAELFGRAPKIKQRCKQVLSLGYELPRRRRGAPRLCYELPEACIWLTPDSVGCAVSIATTVRSRRSWLGTRYDLGLGDVRALLEALDAAAGSVDTGGSARPLPR